MLELKHYQEKNKEDLIRELKVLRAQLAVQEETEALRKRAEEDTKFLKSIILAISESDDLDSAFGMALSKVCEATNWAFGQVWIQTGNNNYLECSPVWYSKLPGLKKFRIENEKFKFKTLVDLPGQVWAIKRPLWITDVSLDSKFTRVELANKFGIKAGFALPIISKKNEVIAVMEFFMLEPKDEDIRLVELVSAVATELGTLFERKKAEDALRQSETRYRLIAKATNDVIWDWDLITNKVSWDGGIEECFGYPINEAGVEESWWKERLHPLDRERAILNLESAIKDKKNTWSDEYRFQCKNGSYAYIIDRGYIVYDENKKPVRMIGCMTNITKLKQTEEELKRLNCSLEKIVEERTKALKENIEKYKKLINSANDVIIVIDAEKGFIIDANAQVENLLGLKPEELPGKHFLKIFPREFHDQYLKMFYELIDKNKAISEAILICHKDGYKIPVEISSSVTEINGKKVLQGIFRDLRQWKQALETKYLLASIVEHSNDAIIGKSLDGIITSWNPAAEQIFGYTESEIKGKHFSVLVPSECMDEALGNFEKIKEGEKIDHYETMRLKKDGTKIQISLTKSPIKDRQGNIIGISAIVRDISAQRQLQAELEKVKFKEFQEREIKAFEELASSAIYVKDL